MKTFLMTCVATAALATAAFAGDAAPATLGSASTISPTSANSGANQLGAKPASNGHVMATTPRVGAKPAAASAQASQSTSSLTGRN